MYKIRTFVSFAALAFCLSGYQAHGMLFNEDPDEAKMNQIIPLQKLDLVGGEVQRNDQKVGQMTNLTELNVLFAPITGRTLTAHPNLRILHFLDCKTFQEDSLLLLPNLTRLDSCGDNNITGCTLASLPHLTTLGISSDNSNFNEEFLQDLTQLTALDVNNNKVITGRTSTNLTNLKKLNLNRDAYGQSFEGRYLRQLTTLEHLDLRSNCRIQDEDVQPLTCLTYLNLWGTLKITDEGISGLTNLTELNLFQNKNITAQGLAGLPHLLSLDLGSNRKITNEELATFTNLTDLKLDFNKVINEDCLSNLTNLTFLSLRNTQMISIDTVYKLPKLKSAEIEDSDVSSQQYKLWVLRKLVGQSQLILMESHCNSGAN